MNTEEQAVEHICSVCQASFTRKTHLTRHLRSHMNQRAYACTLCRRATFTRSDLLTRHVKRCSLNPGGVPPSRKKSCLSCIQRKVKCDLQKPCGKCAARGCECIYAGGRSPEMDPGPSMSHAQSDDPSSSRHQEPTMVARPSQLRDDRTARPVDSSSERWGGRPNIFMNQFSGATLPLLGFPELYQDIQSTSSPNPNMFSDATKDSDCSGSTEDSDCSVIVQSVASMESESMFDPLLSNDVPRSVPSSVPPTTTPETSSSTPGDFINPVNKPSGRNFDTPSLSLNIPSAFGSSDATFENLPAGVDDGVDGYLTRFFSSYCRQFPFIHLPTWCKSSPSPLLARAMQASGAIYATGSTERKTADKFILDTLQSNLRQEIFRAFINTPTFDVDAQASLILALASLQFLGLFHRSYVERGASMGYHGMMVAMILKSSLPSSLESWELGDIETTSVPQSWNSWARYETMKRVLLLVYLQDTLMPVFHNVPSCLGENELPFRLPCDDALWDAPDAQRWATLAFADPSALRGAPLHSQLAILLSPHTDMPLAPLNRFASFVTIHALLRAATLAGGTHVPLQRALRQWYVCWLAGGSGPAGAGEHFTSSMLPLYWLAQLLARGDGGDPVCRAGHVRYMTLKRWVNEFWSFRRATGKVSDVWMADPAAAKAYMAMPESASTSETETEDDGLMSWIR